MTSKVFTIPPQVDVGYTHHVIDQSLADLEITPNRIVQINLTTRDPELNVPLQAIRVPTHLKRYGLSSLVNHLLFHDNPDPPKLRFPLPFDFLIDGSYLRTSIDDYLTANGLSAEKPLDVEYVRSQLPPSYAGTFEQDDWISSVQVSSFTNEGTGQYIPPHILTGSFDGQAQIYDLSGHVLVRTEPLHTASIKAVKWISPPSDERSGSFISAGIDRHIKLWQFTYDDSINEFTQAAVPWVSYVSHTSTVTDLSVSTSTSRFLSASADHTIAIWSINPDELPDVSARTNLSNRYKRRRPSPPQIISKSPLATISSHTAPVSQVIHNPQDQTSAYSVSWDHHISTHDLVTAQTVDSRATQHALLSVLALPSLNLLAAGSSARHITLHDPRASSATIQTSILRGHTNAVVSLVASPESEYIFASGSHDGTVRIWDIRASPYTSTDTSANENESKMSSLFVIKRHSGKGGKVFGVDWDKQAGLVSVGEDKMVQVNREEAWVNGSIINAPSKN